MKISIIKAYPKNAKIHDKKQIALIAASIKRFGFDSPIIIDKNNEVIAGHGRLEAAQLLGLLDVPVIRKEKLTADEVKAYRLADNKIAESGWDMKLVLEELIELGPELIDLTGFSSDLLLGADEKDDVLPEKAPAVAKLGDLFALGGYVECPKCHKHLT
jgi:ParB-like chromosome segregation protein Spo0J